MEKAGMNITDDAGTTMTTAISSHAKNSPPFRDQTERANGFTLVELVVVVAVIAILVTFAIPTYSSLVNTAKIGRAKEEIRTLEKEINSYYYDRNVLPSDITLIPHGDLKDPWGHQYVYRPAGTDVANTRLLPVTGDELNDDYDLYSKGANGVTAPRVDDDPNSLDDVVRSGNGGYVGLGKEFASE